MDIAGSTIDAMPTQVVVVHARNEDMAKDVALQIAANSSLTTTLKVLLR